MQPRLADRSRLALPKPATRIAASGELLACKLGDAEALLWTTQGLAQGSAPLRIKHPAPIDVIDVYGAACSMYALIASKLAIVLTSLTTIEADAVSVVSHVPLLPLGDVASTASPTCSALGEQVAAVAVDCNVHVFARDGSERARLEGHEAPVTACAIAARERTLLVTASQDRRFVVWDVDECAVVFRSTILGAFGFTCIATCVESVPARFALGAENGAVHMYVLLPSSEGDDRTRVAVKPLRVLEPLRLARPSAWAVSAAPAKADAGAEGGPTIISCTPGQASRSTRPPAAADETAAVEASTAVVALAFVAQAVDERREAPRGRPHSLAAAEAGMPLLVVVGCAGVVAVNGCSYECTLLDAAPGEDHEAGRSDETGALISGGALFSTHRLLVLSNAFSHSLVIGRLRMGATAVESEPSAPVMVSTVAPPASSPLARALAAPIQTTGHGPRRPAGPLGRSIKSSGYGTAPVMKLHAGGPAMVAAARARTSSRRAHVPRAAHPLRTYDDTGCGSVYVADETPASWWEQRGAVRRCSFAPDGSRIVAASVDGTTLLSRVPPRGHQADGGTALLQGHSAATLCASWAHSGTWVVTTSDDSTACVWNVDAAVGGRTGDPALRIHPAVDMSNQRRPGAQTGSVAPAVQAGQFFYLDRLLLLARGSALLVYHWHAEEGGSESHCRAALRYTWNSKAQQVTDITAPKSCVSHRVVVATSDRGLHLLDLHSGKSALHISMADLHGGGHSKGIKCLRQAPQATDLVLSSATDSTVRLWDLRAGTCVRCFADHTNRHQAIGCDLSPCGRFVAVGGEDKRATIYAVESATSVQTLLGHLDVVSDVAFHPTCPRLLTACHDGRCRIFSR